MIVWLRIQFGVCSTTQSSEVEIDRVNYLNNWLLTFVSAVVPSDLRTRCLLWLKKGRSAVGFFCFVSAFSLRTRSVLIVRVGSAFLLTANWVLRLFRMKLRETTSTHCWLQIAHRWRCKSTVALVFRCWALWTSEGSWTVARIIWILLMIVTRNLSSLYLISPSRSCFSCSDAMSFDSRCMFARHWKHRLQLVAWVALANIYIIRDHCYLTVALE